MAEEGFDYTIKVEGLDTAIAMLNELASKFPAEADRIIEDSAEQIFSFSQGICPVDTGTLLASGYHNHVFLSSTVGYGAPYASYVEWGTSKMSPQPYLTPAIDTYIPQIIEQLEKLAD